MTPDPNTPHVYARPDPPNPWEYNLCLCGKLESNSIHAEPATERAPDDLPWLEGGEVDRLDYHFFSLTFSKRQLEAMSRVLKLPPPPPAPHVRPPEAQACTHVIDPRATLGLCGRRTELQYYMYIQSNSDSSVDVKEWACERHFFSMLTDLFARTTMDDELRIQLFVRDELEIRTGYAYDD